MTHLLLGGGVPRVHGARSPVPPRRPHFPTPRSVRYLATLAAGAYPLRCPPNAWSPGMLALPGQWYWLVTSETPIGWRGGCLAAGLVRSAVRHYCLGRLGGRGRCRFWPHPPRCPSLAPLAMLVGGCRRVAPSGCPLYSPAGTPFHVVCVFRKLCLVAHFVNAVSPWFVRVLMLPRWSRLPPSSCLLARASREVSSQDAGRSVAGCLYPSAVPARVPCSACR